jgi:hypothetical protein
MPVLVTPLAVPFAAEEPKIFKGLGAEVSDLGAVVEGWPKEPKPVGWVVVAAGVEELVAGLLLAPKPPKPVLPPNNGAGGLDVAVEFTPTEANGFDWDAIGVSAGLAAVTPRPANGEGAALEDLLSVERPGVSAGLGPKEKVEGATGLTGSVFDSAGLLKSEAADDGWDNEPNNGAGVAVWGLSVVEAVLALWPPKVKPDVGALTGGFAAGGTSAALGTAVVEGVDPPSLKEPPWDDGAVRAGATLVGAPNVNPAGDAPTPVGRLAGVVAISVFFSLLSEVIGTVGLGGLRGEGAKKGLAGGFVGTLTTGAGTFSTGGAVSLARAAVTGGGTESLEASTVEVGVVEATMEEGAKRLGIVDEGFIPDEEGLTFKAATVLSLLDEASGTVTSGLLILLLSRRAAKAWASRFWRSHLLTPLSALGDAAARIAAFFPGVPIW